MKLLPLEQEWSVCKLAALPEKDRLPALFFLARTREELSLVCPTAQAPHGALAREDGWRAFRVAGVLDFSLVGVLARISSALAEEGIPLFAASTYDTDTVLVKAADWDRALAALARAGMEMGENSQTVS